MKPGFNSVMSARNELDRRFATPGGAESPHVFLRSRCGVLLRIRRFDRVAKPLAANPSHPDAHLAIAHLDRSEWILEKRPVPATRLQRPRSHEQAPFDDDRPHAREAMV